MLLIACGVAYYFLGYQTVRDNFSKVICLFSLLFAAYFITYKLFSITHFYWLLTAGFAFRLLLIFSVPNLSDDVYRFIWDGRLAASGTNPFSYLPNELIKLPRPAGLTQELYEQLNSPNYYTVYPPILQGLFWLNGKVFPVNTMAAIVFFKCIIVVFEAGTFLLLKNLLHRVAVPKHASLLYILNPLIIIELTGNVHFEGVMLFFLLGSLLLLLRHQWQGAAICLALGIATKLLPVLFVPLAVHRLGWKKGLRYVLLTGVTTVALFALLFDVKTAQHLIQSINLFVTKFEFNASLYYLVRWFGTLATGFNLIAWSGPVLALLAAGFICSVSFKRINKTDSNFFITALLVITIWLLFSTTVHPWYLTLPVALAVFTPFRFAIVWSFTAILSYSAYQSQPVQEQLWLVAAGYCLVVAYAAWELLMYKKAKAVL